MSVRKMCRSCVLVMGVVEGEKSKVEVVAGTGALYLLPPLASGDWISWLQESVSHHTCSQQHTYPLCARYT